MPQSESNHYEQQTSPLSQRQIQHKLLLLIPNSGNYKQYELYPQQDWLQDQK